MYRISILALFLSLTSCADQNNNKSAPVFPTKGFELESIPGTNTKFALRNEANKRTIEEGMLVNGVREGCWIIYHDSEKMIPKSITNYAAGKRNGAHTELNNRGGITLLQHYQNDVLNGRTIIYKNGRLIEDAQYKDGILDGMKRTYYDRSDLVQTEVSYKKGQQDGIYRHYNDQGQVVLEFYYKDGEKISGGIVEPPATEGE